MLIRTTIVLITLCLAACSSGGESISGPGEEPNRAPVARQLGVTTDPGTSIRTPLLASDLDNDSLTYIIVDPPSSGTVVLSGSGNYIFEYTPDSGFVGQDSFTFKVNDGLVDSNTAKVIINVNTRPVAQGASYETTDIVPIGGTVSGSDVEGDTLTFEITGQPAQGTLTSFDPSTGDFVYAPNANADGLDSFNFVANDGFRDSIEATIDIEIFGWPGAQQFGSVERDFATTNGLILGADGSLVFGGQAGAQFDGTSQPGVDDAWVRKVDRRGQFSWTRQFDSGATDNARSILPHPNGSDIYIVESNQGGVTEGATIRLLDRNGVETWSTPVDFGAFGSNLAYGAYWANVDAAGDLYLVSWTDTGGALSGGLLSKISGVDGSTIWQVPMDNAVGDPVNPFLDNTTQLRPRSVAFDASGNIIVAGSFIDDQATPQRACDTCSFIASFDADGNELWIQEINAMASQCPGTIDGAQINRVTVAANGDLIAVGIANDLVDANPNGVIGRLNADATSLSWVHCDETGALASFWFTPALEAGDGDLLVASTQTDLSVTLPDGTNPSDVIVHRFTASGDVVFRTVIGAALADGSKAFVDSGSIVEGPLGEIYLTGSTNGEIAGTPLAGVQDAFLLRLDAEGNIRN